MKRVKYRDPNDLTTVASLQRAETVIKSFDPAAPGNDINDILEYCSIIKYFDNKVFLSSWDAETIISYTATVNQFRAVVGRFFHTVQGRDLSELYGQTDVLLKEDFIASISEYKVYERITPEEFSYFIEKNPQAMGLILRQSALVHKFGQVITEHLVNNIRFAELILRHFYAKKDGISKNHMPEELTEETRKDIIEKYIEWDHANVNYLKLISLQRKSIEDKTRLSARRRASERWKEHFGSGQNTMTFGVEILFCDQDVPIKESMDSSEMLETISYSRQWINENLDYPTLLNNFIYLFFFTDLYFRCEFLSNEKELSVFERLAGVHDKSEYPIGVAYRARNMRSVLQMIAYQEELRTHAIEIEGLFQWFFEEYLNQEFGIENYCYFAPSVHASDLEKIVLIASQIDAALKQFSLFVQNKTIDQELVEFSSSRVVDIPSLIEKKYVYSYGKTMQSKLFYLFSDQSMLGCTEKTKDQYTTLVSLIENEKVLLSDFAAFQQNFLNWLIEQGVLHVDEVGYLYVPHPLVDLMSDLYKKGSIVYSYCSKKERALIDGLIEKGELEVESRLFTRQEQDYYNYMMNARKFSNGRELRNKYVHGSYPIDPEIHRQDYIEMLKIMTLIVIKINEEFCLAFPMDKQ